jgi:hypothetical protein
MAGPIALSARIAASWSTILTGASPLLLCAHDVYPGVQEPAQVRKIRFFLRGLVPPLAQLAQRQLA